MKRLWQVTIGVLTVVPLFTLVALVVFFSLHPEALDALMMAGGVSPQLYAGPDWGLQVGIWGAGIGFCLYVYYLVWIIRTSRLTAKGKVIWIAALSLAGPVSMPILWWRHFRPS